MFDNLLPQPLNNGIQKEQSIKKKHELRYIGSQRKRRGLITFSYNTVTGEIKAAEIKRCNTIDFATGEPLYNPKIIMEKNCLYMQAMNKENCKRHFKQQGYTRFAF